MIEFDNTTRENLGYSLGIRFIDLGFPLLRTLIWTDSRREWHAAREYGVNYHEPCSVQLAAIRIRESCPV